MTRVEDEMADTLPPTAPGTPAWLRQPTRVLLVEPAPLIRHFIMRALSATGYEVHAVQSLAELEAAFAFQPELVLAELFLADGSGDGVCQRVRARFGTRVPVVLMSRGSEEELARRAARCDATRFFSKVRGLNVLLPIVHELALDAEAARAQRAG
jgi:DNA-binding response OmpR family regulator